MIVKLVVEVWIQPTRRKGAHLALGAVVLAQHASPTYLQFSGSISVLQNMFETFHWKEEEELVNQLQ